MLEDFSIGRLFDKGSGTGRVGIAGKWSAVRDEDTMQAVVNTTYSLYRPVELGKRTVGDAV